MSSTLGFNVVVELILYCFYYELQSTVPETSYEQNCSISYAFARLNTRLINIFMQKQETQQILMCKVTTICTWIFIRINNLLRAYMLLVIKKKGALCRSLIMI